TWGATFGVALLGPCLFFWAGYWGQLALGSGWLLTALAGVGAGHSARTGTGLNAKFLERVALVAPHVFIAGLIVTVALLVSVWVDNPPTVAAPMAAEETPDA